MYEAIVCSLCGTVVMNIVLHRFSVLLYDSVRSKKEGREKRKKRDEIGVVL